MRDNMRVCSEAVGVSLDVAVSVMFHWLLHCRERQH